MTNGITMGNTAGIYTVSASITPAEVATIVAVEQTFTLPSVKTGDIIIATPPTEAGALSLVSARATAANTVGITWINPTAGALTPVAGTYKFTVIRPTGNVAATSIVD